MVAILPELATVYVAVTGRAVLECQADIFSEEGVPPLCRLCLAFRHHGMTLCARYRLVFARKVELRLRVVKLGRWFPALGGVALQALLRQLTTMFIFVATQAIL